MDTHKTFLVKMPLAPSSLIPPAPPLFWFICRKSLKVFAP